MQKKQPSGPAVAEMSPAQRRFLYITAAITGGAIMIVEILGAKMLAPFVGTSHFVWTAQIAVTMVALAAGYYAGGSLVDRSPRLGKLYGAILIAALYLGLSILVIEGLAGWALRFKLAAGTLIASMLLYFVPLSLMAMVGPFLVRIITSSVIGVGGNVGRLTAISTLGSFAGTVLVGYIIIPFLPNSLSMALTAILLLLITAVYFLIWGRSKPVPTVLLYLGMGAAIAFAGMQSKLSSSEAAVELYRGNSNFGLLQVFQSRTGPDRFYLNDYLTQNTYDTNAQQSISMFTYMLHLLAKAYTPATSNVFCIGLGVGIVPMQFARDGAKVDVVEINPAVIPVAKQFFNFDPAKMNVILGDGRYHLNKVDKKYDAVILDAFLGDSSPSHLMTREAFTAMRNILRAHGVLVINCFGDFDQGRDYFVASLNKTLRAVFKSVRIHNERNGGNVFFVASQNSELTILRPPDLGTVHPSQRGNVERAFARLVDTNPESGIVLTDDYNPVEYYDSDNRERFRRDLVFHVRNL